MYLEPQDFVEFPATHIVSLGEACANAYNLRRHYNFGGAYPFDWWVSDADGVARFLTAPSLDALYDAGRLTLTGDGNNVCHRDYNFIFQHEFPRDWSSPGNPVHADWRAQLEKPRQRSAALLRKLQALNEPGNRIAFIRNGRNSPAITPALAGLFPKPDWTFIHLNYIPSFDGGWKGDLTLWDEALAALGLRLDHSLHKPFTEADPEVEFAAAHTPAETS